MRVNREYHTRHVGEFSAAVVTYNTPQSIFGMTFAGPHTISSGTDLCSTSPLNATAVFLESSAEDSDRIARIPAPVTALPIGAALITVRRRCAVVDAARGHGAPRSTND